MVNKIFLALILTLAGLLSAHGGVTESADSAYNKRNYEEAAILYQDALDNEGISAGLLYNLGNCYYRLGKDGEAMLCYERAKKLEPSNPLIRQNLIFLSAKVQEANKGSLQGGTGNMEPDRETFLDSVYRAIAVDQKSNNWAVFAVMAFILFLGAAAMYVFTPNVLARKTGFFSGLTFLGFTVVFVVFAFLAADHYDRQEDVILMDFSTELLDQPNEHSRATTSALHKGTKLKILESKTDVNGLEWIKVKLNSDNIGWLKKQSVEVI